MMAVVILHSIAPFRAVEQVSFLFLTALLQLTHRFLEAYCRHGLSCCSLGHRQRFRARSTGTEQSCFLGPLLLPEVEKTMRHASTYQDEKWFSSGSDRL